MTNKNHVKWVCDVGVSEIDAGADLLAAKKVEKSRLGDKALYYVHKGIMYGVPYGCMKRVFKRIEPVGTRLACCRVSFDVHSIVLCGDEGEIAEIKYDDQREAEFVYNYIVKRVENIIKGKN